MNDADPKVFHDRARESASEQRKLLTSLATGSLAAFFIALTTKVEPALTGLQQILLLAALLAMGTVVLSGILGWHWDAERWYFWAKSLETKDPGKSTGYLEKSRKFSRWNYHASRILRCGFMIGICLAIGYLALRIAGP